MKTLFLLFSIIFGGYQLQAQIYSLDDFQWTHRLLLIYSQDEQKLENQLSQIKQVKSSFEQRDLLVVILSTGQAQLWNSNKTGELNYRELIDKIEINRTEDYLNFLIGKDGTVKLKSSSPILNNKLFSTIDAMPMRKREMWNDQ